MSISEYTIRQAVSRAVAALDNVANAEHPGFTTEYMLGYLEGIGFAYRHAGAIVREELSDYLPPPAPCGCGNPSEGKDITGAPICMHCMALTAQAIEELETS